MRHRICSFPSHPRQNRNSKEYREVLLLRSHLFSACLLAFLVIAAQAAAVTKYKVPAKAAVVIDSSGAVIYAKYPNARLAPASTVKLVTAMIAIDILRPNDVVTISRNAARVRTIPPRLHAGEEYTVSDLLHLALMKSINSAAVALAEASAGSEQAFVVLMNRKARELGARDTLFANASGLPKGGTQYSTASDLARIMKAALSYPLIREILATKEYAICSPSGRDIVLENSNHLLWQEPAVIVGKTGYTGNARHCFVGAVETGNGMVYTAVLGARSRNTLWRAAALLAEVGEHPELAQDLEPFSAGGRFGRTRVRKTKPVTVGVLQNVTVEDIQRSRLEGVFSRTVYNN
jgi:D-alanyl-D-alanine carboxypeptidase (penicillin-binding protein 5/6)